MHAATEVDFERMYTNFKEEYSMHKNIVRYVSNGWCEKMCIWREMWPRFGRLFSHKNVETTNLVERLWQYVKYTLLDAQINRSAIDLLHALVGGSKTGARMGAHYLSFSNKNRK